MSANLTIVMKAAERMGANLPADERVKLILSLFSSLDESKQKTCFTSLIEGDITLLDALMLMDANPVEETKPAAKETPKPAAKPAAKEEPKPAVKPAAKEEPKPAAKKEPKPARKSWADMEDEEEVKPVAKEETKSFLTATKANSDVVISAPVAKKLVPRRNKVKSTKRVVATSATEVADLIRDGKSICGYHGTCNKPTCQWIHCEGDFLCLKYGNCQCKKTHLKDLPVPKAYNLDTKVIVHTQEEYDDAYAEGYRHCTGEEYCYRACTFMHIAKGKQCHDAYCEDESCELVHVGVCNAMVKNGKCENWNGGRCGFEHRL